MLAANPDLVRARAETSEPPYNGYFHNAALLHHVAGNPIRGDLPANIVQITQTLLDAGADVGAECGGGPDQPDTGGGNTLGLVASGARAAEQGLSEGLIDTLIGAGADVNAGNGGCLMTALYHTSSAGSSARLPRCSSTAAPKSIFATPPVWASSTW